MKLKPGYKQTETGVIPEEWEIKSLRGIGEIRTGPFGTLLKATEYSGREGVPLISVGEISVGRLRITDRTPLVPIAVVKRLPQYVLKEGDIVFGRKGAVDRSAMVTSEQDGWFLGSDGISIRPAKSCCALYIAYQLQRNEVRSWLIQNATGTTMASLNQDLLNRVSIPYAPLPEQRAIAAALSDTDALLSSLGRLLAKKRDIKQGVMQQLLTGKQRLPGFSGEWKPEKIGRLFQFLSTGNNPRSDLSELGNVGYVHYGDIHTKEIAFLECASAVLPLIAYNKVSGLPLLQNGDLVMADASEDYAGVGKSVEIKNVGSRKIVAGLHTFLLRGDKELLADGYKGYLQFLPSVKAAMTRYAVGISVYGISKTNIRNIEINLPLKDEQIAIVAVLSDMDAEIDALQLRRDKTRAIKQGMMQELLTGKTRLV